MSKEWMVSDDELAVRFDAVTRIFSVEDRRCGKIWAQASLDASLVLSNVSQREQTLALEFTEPVSFTATFELAGDSELFVSLTADADSALEKLPFPPAFRTPDESHFLLQTDGEGLLLPVNDARYPLEENPFFYCGGGPAMAWMGVTDAAFETGYMAIFETPFDAAIETRREEGLITFAPVWLGSMGRFSYVRKLRYAFFDRGGYVAQCKKYRKYIWPKNEVKTLRQKQEKFPAIEKMLGAVHIYVWDRAREVDFARKLQEAGIERAMIIWNPNHLPYPEPGYDEELKELGYATGGYELLTDIHPENHPGNARITEIPLKRNVFPGLFEKITSLKADGSRYSNQFGTYVCPLAVRPEMIKRVDKELAIYPHETYFVDVWQANGLYECHHPEHPLTREQYAGAILTNLQLLEEHYGLFNGAEWGADYAGSHSVYAHGMMTLQRLWFGSEIEKPGTIHYYGNWKSNSRPSIMLGTRIAPPDYLTYGINETIRVPLFELVYHDAILTSWRWEDCNHHTPEIWWKKDLFNILYGNAPLWSIDQDRWEAFRVTFLSSYQSICPWLQEICYDEMLSHHFLTQNRKVQETAFSSGRRVVVNFGDDPFQFEGLTIAARSCQTFTAAVSSVE